MNIFNKGSEWRRWDLHLHTASSYDHDYKAEDSDLLLSYCLTKHHIAVAAITDHFKIDANRIKSIRALTPGTVILPGVELRTDKGDTNVHIIAIFSEKLDLVKLENDFNVLMLGEKAKNADDNDKIRWDFEDIKSFVGKRNGLLSIHAGKKSNGIDKRITSALPINEAILEEYASGIHIFEMGRINDLDVYRTKVFKAIEPKPMIICSDNHDPRNYTFKEKLWIKSDPTFDGLIQCLYAPNERVFVGEIPPKLDSERKNKSIYIDSVTVKKRANAINKSENWFDFTLPINSGLTAIIGNKGSGKSALSDIVAHFCNSKSNDEASFLNNQRFRKKDRSYADDYEGHITWLDGKTEKDIQLSKINRDSSIETAQYLPQKYIEKVCNELGDEFQSEIRLLFSLSFLSTIFLPLD